ncbi:MAG: 3,4-dihydroxy-2-butanone-4-phosphate synthase [Deltaproteobacteria bacterium]|nr:3,4-dihydroxy-2-butanone-4-phosphate synthase [Deltaproteobacteria bacterium]
MAAIQQALKALKAGKPIVLVDDESRENEGDLILAAEKITPENVNFMIRHGSGIICVTLTEDQADQLNLPLMVQDNHLRGKFAANFTISVEAAQGVTTGVSAADRCKTILAAMNPNSKPEDLSRPGHVFPLRAKNGGVLEREGHTEGSVDLMRLAKLTPAGVLCELMNEDGTMARMPEIEKFAREHDLIVLSIKELVELRRGL